MSALRKFHHSPAMHLIKRAGSGKASEIELVIIFFMVIVPLVASAAGMLFEAFTSKEKA